MEDAYKYLVDNQTIYDGFYTVYDIDDDGVKELIYYSWYDSSDPNAIYSRSFKYGSGKIVEIDVDYDSCVKGILNKTQWCKMNDMSLVNEVFKNNISVILNGNELTFAQQPYIENGTTRVPMRGIFESLGATVE